jgi:hypothetical protein
MAKGQTIIYKTQKTNDQTTRTPIRTGGELRCTGRVSSSCSTCDTRRATHVTNPAISHNPNTSNFFILT